MVNRSIVPLARGTLDRRNWEILFVTMIVFDESSNIILAKFDKIEVSYFLIF